MDIGMRTKNEGVREAVYLEVMGPMIVGGQKKHVSRKWSYYDVWDDDDGFGGLEDGQWVLAFDALDGNLEKIWPITAMPALSAGDKVKVINLTNGEERDGGVVSFGQDDGEILGFRVNIPADAGDDLLVQVFDGGSGQQIWETATQSKTSGYGYKRNSPDLRRMMGLSQLILDPRRPGELGEALFHGRASGDEGQEHPDQSHIGRPERPVECRPDHGPRSRSPGLRHTRGRLRWRHGK